MCLLSLSLILHLVFGNTNASSSCIVSLVFFFAIVFRIDKAHHVYCQHNLLFHK
jgi:hypothetical protein